MSVSPSSSFIALEPRQNDKKACGPTIPPPMFDEEGHRPGTLVMALMLSRRCNMSCGHCSVESGPKIKEEPSEEELLQTVRDAAAAGARVFQLTGGEPMLRENVVMRLLTECRSLGLMTTLSTNAFWGKSPEAAEKKVQALAEAGLRRLTISYDRFHAEFQGSEPAVNIIRASEKLKAPFLINLNFTRTADDDLEDLVAPFQDFPLPQMRFYDVQPVGRARELESPLRTEVRGYCTGCNVPTVTDDGRVTACNGPAYFSAPQSPLVLGSLREESMATLVERHRTDPILDTIRIFGPAYLREVLEKTPEFDGLAFRESYSGMCDLCLHINSEPKAVEELNRQLATPAEMARRIAAQRVMTQAQKFNGGLHREYVNSVGAARVFLASITQPPAQWEEDVEKILGRPDLDWNHQLQYLTSCGLALPLQNTMLHPTMERWAPPFFIERMKRHGIGDSLRASTQREILRRIAEAVRECGTTGVLLKGAAMMAIDIENPPPAGALPGRSGGDVDVLISPAKASQVRERLLQMGFTGKANKEDADGLHQLENLTFRAVTVEIHQSIQPKFCGLPEEAMLAAARPLKTTEFEGLSTLDGEGMLLHSAVHLSKHLFIHGLKTAYDFLWLLDRFPQMDWEHLRTWVKRTGMSRGFWAPVCVLNRELSLGFPEELLKYAPHDRRQRRLERIARRHILKARKFAVRDNPWICEGLFLAMSDSWAHRFRRVIAVLGGQNAHELQRKPQPPQPGVSHNKGVKLIQAFYAWRKVS